MQRTTAGFRAARARAASASATATTAADRFITGQTGNNVTPYIANLVGRDLHKKRPITPSESSSTTNVAIEGQDFLFI